MTIVLYLAPLLVAAGFLGLSKRPAWFAGAAALAAAIPAILAALPDSVKAPAFFELETAKGAWLAWSAIAVMAGGLFSINAPTARIGRRSP